MDDVCVKAKNDVTDVSSDSAVTGLGKQLSNVSEKAVPTPANSPVQSPPTTKKHSGKAALLSGFVCPGVGQLYNRQWLKGIIVITLFMTAFIIGLYYVAMGLVDLYSGATAMMEPGGNIAESDMEKSTELFKKAIIPGIVAFITYMYSIIDAYWN